MSSQPQNDNHHSQPFDGLAPEFSSDDPLERRLLADGSRWRARTAPAIEPFARRVHVALRENMSRRLADTFVEERPMSQRSITPPPRTASQPPRRRPSKWGTLVAVAAAVAIVAMLAWVFQAIPHSRVASKSATPTPNYAAHVTHPRGHWADVVQYNDFVTVAPSDPRVAYRRVASPSDSSALTLARTTNGGAMWTTLTLPTDDGGVWSGDLDISPLDPQTIFLTLSGDQTNPHCPAYISQGPGTDIGPATLQAASTTHADAQLGPLHPTGGGYSCSFQYVSRDGGAHWTHPQFPWQAQRLAGFGNPGAVEAQGATLFAALAGNLNGPAYVGVRLVSSSDGGTTWSAADADIFATGQIVSSYTLMPGTSEIYALSVPQQKAYNEVTSATVWRSEDAGAHWARVGTCPLFEASLIGTTNTPGGPTLYALRLDTYPGGPEPVYASRDRGQTWSPVPTTGWPRNQMLANWAPNVLADGSLLLEFLSPSTPDMPVVSYLDNTNAMFYAWRPGDTSWFRAVPPPGSATVTQAWVTMPANGPQALWIVVRSPQGTTFTVRQDVLE